MPTYWSCVKEVTREIRVLLTVGIINPPIIIFGIGGGESIVFQTILEIFSLLSVALVVAFGAYLRLLEHRRKESIRWLMPTVW